MPSTVLKEALFYLSAVILAISACSSSSNTASDATAAGDSRIAEPIVDLKPGRNQVLIGIRSISWDGPPSPGRDSLTVEITLANGAGSDPAPLNPVYFAVQTDQGAEILGNTDVGFDTACLPDIAVLAEASRSCQLLFHLPQGEKPETLVYRTPEKRQTKTEILPCSAKAARGLCEKGQLCLNEDCVDTCSRSNPRGPCLDTNEICSEGWCQQRCRPEYQSGACLVGECVRGFCDERCVGVRALGGACQQCLPSIAETCTLADRPECSACFQCIAARSISSSSGVIDSCACETCSESCQQTMGTYLACQVTHCPACGL